MGCNKSDNNLYRNYAYKYVGGRFNCTLYVPFASFLLSIQWIPLILWSLLFAFGMLLLFFFVWFPIFWLWYRCAWLHVQVVWCFLIYVTNKHCQSKVKSCRNLVMWKKETCLNNNSKTTMLMYACSTFWVHSFFFENGNMEMFCDFGSRERGERVKQKITSPNILTLATQWKDNQKVTRA